MIESIWINTGDRVRVTNPKHKWYMCLGRVTRMDRGNVWVQMIGVDQTICTRSKSLEKA